jgi:recombination protein RecT
MTENTVSNAVAVRDTGPASMVTQYHEEYAALLPSHVNADQWVRLAVGAIRGNRDLEQAAQNDVGVFLRELKTAARLGLEPGTEQYYLTPRNVKGQYEILGIVGYQGLIELMYRAGAISSVVAECVYSGDQFAYQPGVDERPRHQIDWDADDRGQLRLVYAYAVMKDGATSKVIVMNRAAIQKIKGSSQGADSSYSPWQTNEPAMWLKSAVRQLAKWVPTSAEFMREQLRAEREVAAELTAPAFQAPEIPAEQQPIDVSHLPVESVFDAEIVDPDPRDDA